MDFNIIRGKGTTTNSGNDYLVSLDNVKESQYIDGGIYVIKINTDNSGASTLDIDGLGVKNIKKIDGSDVGSGDLQNGSTYLIIYDGTNLILSTQIVGSGASSNLGNILFVSTNGDDGTAQKGNIGLPYKTKNEAFQNAVNGDTVMVFPGIYDELVIVDGAAYAANTTIRLFLLPGVVHEYTGGDDGALYFYNQNGGAFDLILNVSGAGILRRNGSGANGHVFDASVTNDFIVSVKGLLEISTSVGVISNSSFARFNRIENINLIKSTASSCIGRMDLDKLINNCTIQSTTNVAIVATNTNDIIIKNSTIIADINSAISLANGIDITIENSLIESNTTSDTLLVRGDGNVVKNSKLVNTNATGSIWLSHANGIKIDITNSEIETGSKLGGSCNFLAYGLLYSENNWYK